MSGGIAITVITPVLNGGANIEDCIVSVLDQSYENWEHIVIDGGSQDDTLEVVRRYDHLKCISEPDSGVYAAMNKGIKMAQGEWLYFLGSDDYLIDASVFSKAADNFSEQFDVLYGNVISPRFGGKRGEEFDYRDIYHKNICHQAIFFKRDAITKIGLFNLKYKIHADWEHNMRWLLSPKISKRYVDLDIAYYSDGGLSSKSEDQLFKKHKLAHYLMSGFNTIPDGELKALLVANFRASIRYLSPGRILNSLLLILRYFFSKVKMAMTKKHW